MSIVSLPEVIPEQGYSIDGDLPNQGVAQAAIECDLDKDGFGEVILGNPSTSNNQGMVNVVWGSPFNTVKPNTTSDIVPPLGVSISASITFQDVGASLACVDINQDGYLELVIGAYSYQRAPLDTPGAVYVIYFNGTRLTNNINLESLTPSQGFIILGTANADQFGYAMDNVGDVNGDGQDDVAIGAPYAGEGTPGKVYVIYSQPGFNAFDVSILNTNATAGFMLQGTTDSSFGYSVGKAGDFNNDGYADIVIGAPRSSFATINTGSAYVVFGNATRVTPTFVNGLTNMIRFDGNPSGQQPHLGHAVAHAGHFNNDPYSDIVVSAPFEASPTGVRGVGYVFVIFGREDFPSITNVNALGSDAFKIYGREAYAGLGYSLAGGEDVNGDGFDDVVLGEHYSYLRADNERDGAAYVLFGNTLKPNTNFNINTLNDTQGYTIRAYSYGRLGHSALAFGNLNKKGPDILIAAPLASPNGTTSAGIFYALSGRLQPILTTSNSTVSCTEDAAPVLVDSGITVIDLDNPTIASAKISISGGFTNGDILGFIDQNGIAGQYNAGTGILTLTGVASVEDYETALQSVAFQTDNVTFSNRTISFVVNDGAKDSKLAIKPLKLVPLDNLLTGSGTNVLCLNQESSQLLFPQLNIVGGDALTLQNATVTISDFMATEDSLEFTDLGNNVSANFDNSTGTLTFTGPVSASAFEATLQTVKYINSNNDTNSAIKTFGVAVDYAGQVSNAVASQINLITVNDAPVVINPVRNSHVQVDEPFSLVFSNDTFNQPANQLSLSVKENGGPLTSLNFNATTDNLSGSLSQLGKNPFSLFATGSCNLTAESDFIIDVSPSPVSLASPISEEPFTSSQLSSPVFDNTGALVGGLVGGIAGLLCVAGTLWGAWAWKRKQDEKEGEKENENANNKDQLQAIETGSSGVKENPLYKKGKRSWYNFFYKPKENEVVDSDPTPDSDPDPESKLEKSVESSIDSGSSASSSSHNAS